MPSACASEISCSKVWPASSAWFCSMLTFDLLLQAVRLEEAEHRGDVVVVLVLQGSAGLGSIRMAPLKPILCLCSTTSCREAPELRRARA